MISIDVNTLNEYQDLAHTTANETLNYDVALATAALGIAGEAGEVADHVKKYIGHGHELDRDKVIKELGDVLWYVAEVSTLLGVPLRQIAQKNIIKLAERYPKGFSEIRSKFRNESE